MVWILPMTTPNFVEEPRVKVPEVTCRSSSPAPRSERDFICTLVASPKTKRKNEGKSCSINGSIGSQLFLPQACLLVS